MSRMTIIDTWSNIPITCEAKDQMRPRNFSCEIVRTISRRYTFGASFFLSIPPTIIEESRDRADRSSLAARPATQQPQKETRRINGGSGWPFPAAGNRLMAIECDEPAAHAPTHGSLLSKFQLSIVWLIMRYLLDSSSSSSVMDITVSDCRLALFPLFCCWQTDCWPAWW